MVEAGCPKPDGIQPDTNTGAIFVNGKPIPLSEHTGSGDGKESKRDTERLRPFEAKKGIKGQLRGPGGVKLPGKRNRR